VVENRIFARAWPAAKPISSALAGIWKMRRHDDIAIPTFAFTKRDFAFANVAMDR
jgi:hypothetical protein